MCIHIADSLCCAAETNTMAASFTLTSKAHPGPCPVGTNQKDTGRRALEGAVQPGQAVSPENCPLLHMGSEPQRGWFTCPGPHSQYLGLSDPKSMQLHPTPTAFRIPVQPICPEDTLLRFVEKMEIGPFFYFCDDPGSS